MDTNSKVRKHESKEFVYIVDDYWHVEIWNEEARRVHDAWKARQYGPPVTPTRTMSLCGSLCGSPANLIAQHQDYRARFVADNDDWGTLKEHLTRKRDDYGVKITKIVGLSLGSVNKDCCPEEVANKPYTATRKTVLRESAFLSVLMEFYGIKTCICQDPIFETADKKFLEKLGYEVVKDPAAFQQIDEETLVWVYDGRDVDMDSIFQGKHPALLISDDLCFPRRAFWNLNRENEAEVKSFLSAWMTPSEEEASRGKTRRETVNKVYPGQWSWKGMGLLHTYESDLVVYSKESYPGQLEILAKVNDEYLKMINFWDGPEGPAA